MKLFNYFLYYPMFHIIFLPGFILPQYHFAPCIILPHPLGNRRYIALVADTALSNNLT